MLPMIVFPDLNFAEVLQTYYHGPRQKTVVLERQEAFYGEMLMKE